VPTKPPISQEELAANYGWVLGMLRSNPELSKLFNAAVADEYSPQMFVAKLRDTKWYKSRGEASRQADVLKTADPGEWKRRSAQSRAMVADIYTQLTGQAAPAKLLATMAGQAFQYGFSEAEIRDMVGRSFSAANQMKNGIGGSLGEAERQIRGAIEDYGLDLGEGWIARQLNNVATQRTDITATQNYLRQVAMRKYAAFKDELEQGMTVKDIAEPYRQLMAKTLEISDKSLSVTDASIQKALLHRLPGKGGKPGQPEAMALWQFEQQLKADPRWNGTQNAQDSIMAAGRKVLTDMGMIGGAA